MINGDHADLTAKLAALEECMNTKQDEYKTDTPSWRRKMQSEKPDTSDGLLEPLRQKRPSSSWRSSGCWCGLP